MSATLATSGPSTSNYSNYSFRHYEGVYKAYFRDAQAVKNMQAGQVKGYSHKNMREMEREGGRKGGRGGGERESCC
jgi:hypothetical protein